MKAIVYDKFGAPEMLYLTDIDKPVPAANELLIKTHATSLNAYDWRHVRADPFLIRFMGGGLLKPKHKILGADIAGKVEAIGNKVTLFKPGDEVFGEVGYGGLAEYVCADEEKLVTKPHGISFDQSAASPMAALTALQGLRDDGKIKSGQKVLINGASGGVGSYAVQIAKSFGAEVTGVCSSSKVELVRSFGADHVVDYLNEDVTKAGKQYDLIFDIAAYRPAKEYREIMKTGGYYVVAGGSIKRIFQLMLKSMFGSKDMMVTMAKNSREDLQIIQEMLESGKIKSFIDKTYPLEDTARAIKYLEEGNARGKVIVSII